MGVPVRNGGDYLDATLTSLRAQSLRDLEIVVSDNASDDDTVELVRRHAEADPRVRLVQQPSDVGAAPNYNAVFEASRGEFFCWNAHDDLRTPGWLEAAVAALRADPAASIAFSRSFRVDGEGTKLAELPIAAGLAADDPVTRWRTIVRSDPELVVFGLARRSVLEHTRLHGSYTGSDRPFVGELLLLGRAVEVDGVEFHLREHPNRSVRRLSRGKGRFDHARESWFATDRAGRIVFPAWRRFGAYLGSAVRLPLRRSQRVRAVGAVLGYLLHARGRLLKMMANDVAAAVLTVLARIRGGARR